MTQSFIPWLYPEVKEDNSIPLYYHCIAVETEETGVNVGHCLRRLHHSLVTKCVHLHSAENKPLNIDHHPHTIKNGCPFSHRYNTVNGTGESLLLHSFSFEPKRTMYQEDNSSRVKI